MLAPSGCSDLPFFNTVSPDKDSLDSNMGSLSSSRANSWPHHDFYVWDGRDSSTKFQMPQYIGGLDLDLNLWLL